MKSEGIEEHREFGGALTPNATGLSLIKVKPQLTNDDVIHGMRL